MILIQTVSSVLHDVETEVFKADMANPFPLQTHIRYLNLCADFNRSYLSGIGSPDRDFLLATAAAIVRLVAQMDIENCKKEKK